MLRIISCQWCVASLQLFSCQAFVCSLLGKTVLSFQLSSMSALTLCIISTLPCPNELPFTHSTVKPHILFPLQFQPSSCHPCPFFFLLLFIQEMQLLPHSIPVKPPFRATSISYSGDVLDTWPNIRGRHQVCVYSLFTFCRSASLLICSYLCR